MNGLGKKLFFLLSFCLLAASAVLRPVFAAQATGTSDSSPEDTSAPIQIHGDSVEYFHEDQKAVGIGNVSIDYDQTRLTADKITVFMDKKVAVAEGHVVLKQPGSTFEGARGEYDFGRKIGNVDGMQASFDPGIYGKAQKMEKISEEHFRAKNAYITTCCGDSPFYRVQASDIDYFPGKKVVARNALIFIKNVPIFWIPVYVQPLVNGERFPVQLIPGKNSEWGPFLLSKWRYELADSPSLQSRGSILADYRVKRGFGAGAENFYDGERIGRGAVRGYWAGDKEAPPDGEYKDRYRGQWRHQVELGEATTLTTEYNNLSDPDIVKDFFFREEYERDAFPDNYISLITSKPEYTFSALDRERMDSFFTVVERSPELRFDTHTRRFAETPFYLRQEYQFTNLKKEFANSELQFDALRGDMNQTLFYDAHFGPLAVTPRIGTRQTWYSRGLVDGDDRTRGTLDPGVDTSIRFFKTYDWSNHALGLDWNGIRHVFTPTTSYNFRPNPTAPRSVLAQFDSLDALDKRNFTRFHFENKLLTKEHQGKNRTGPLVSREMLRAIPFFDYDYDSNHIENVGYDVEFRPYSWMGIESDAIWNPHENEFETVNVDFYFTRDPFVVGVGQRFVNEESSQTTAEIRWKVNEEWSLRAYERFEWETAENEEFEFTVSKAFECVIADFTYNRRDRSGDSFFIVLRLKSFPKASFGLSQTYNRPKASPSAPRL